MNAQLIRLLEWKIFWNCFIIYLNVPEDWCRTIELGQSWGRVLFVYCNMLPACFQNLLKKFARKSYGLQKLRVSTLSFSIISSWFNFYTVLLILRNYYERVFPLHVMLPSSVNCEYSCLVFCDSFKFGTFMEILKSVLLKHCNIVNCFWWFSCLFISRDLLKRFWMYFQQHFSRVDMPEWRERLLQHRAFWSQFLFHSKHHHHWSNQAKFLNDSH